MSNGKVGLAVIGCGRISRAHLPAIGQIGEIERIATVDALGDRAEKAAGDFGFKRWYTSADQALADPEVEAVLLLLPHDGHCPATIRALEAGKHVLVEKPMALDTAEADRMIAAARAAGRNLMVAHVIRFMWAQRQARQLIDQGAVGTPLQVIERRLEQVAAPVTDWWSSQTQTGGLVWMLNGSHSIDTVLWLLDTRATSIYAQFGHHNPAWQGEDFFSTTLSMANGAFATLHQSFDARAPIFDCVVIGSEATLEIHGFNEVVLHSRGGKHTVTPTENENAYALQDREFALSILEQREPLASGTDVRKVMQVLDAGRQSAREHKIVGIED